MNVLPSREQAQRWFEEMGPPVVWTIPLRALQGRADGVLQTVRNGSHLSKAR